MSTKHIMVSIATQDALDHKKLQQTTEPLKPWTGRDCIQRLHTIDSKAGFTVTELNREELKDVIKEAVQESFLQIGVDISSPGAVQEIQQDFAYIRANRKTWDTLYTRSRWILVGVFIISSLTAIWWGIKSQFV